MNQKQRKLFVSFTSLLRELKQGTITQADLDSGLYYFGCIREHAVDPWQDDTNEVQWFFKGDMDRGRQVHEQLKEAVLKAEQEGRIVFRSLEDYNTYEQLNALLVANGYEPLDSEMEFSYNYPRVEELVQEKGLALTAVR